MNIVAIAVFGAIGGLLRLLVESTVQTGNGFPISTFAINLAGSFALGLFYAVAECRDIREWIKLGVGVGLIGAFTTFSTFSWDIVQLAHARPGLMALYILGSIVGGPFVAYVGDRMGLRMFGVARDGVTQGAEPTLASAESTEMEGAYQ